MTLPMDFNLNIPPTGQDPPVVASSPLDDWCMGYNPIKNAPVVEIQDSEPSRVEVPPPMDAAHLHDPCWVALIYSYHEVRTLPNRWVVTLPGEPLVLPPGPLMPFVEDMDSCVIDELVLHSN
ncbi:hypothetical protein HAX54_045214 [Datura stramonium]|uniref:Uncharacterized protein n=1 Tax=Datura stramonium TaxID=4076 RepID=A0ABS8RH36_DATST|nr:hypothetical protein [Datura stramonium]